MIVNETGIDEIRPYPRNAKKHPEKQVQQIAESIRKFGWAQPIAIDKDGVIIIGHGRYEAAKLLELETVPCVMIDDLSEEEIRMLRLADNKLNESEWDFDILDEELQDLDFGDLDLDWGFNDEPVGGAANDVGNFEPTSFHYQSQYGVTVILDNEIEQEECYNKLSEMGYNCRVVTV